MDRMFISIYLCTTFTWFASIIIVHTFTSPSGDGKRRGQRSLLYNTLFTYYYSQYKIGNAWKEPRPRWC